MENPARTTIDVRYVLCVTTLLQLFSGAARGAAGAPESVYGPEIEARMFSEEMLEFARDFAGGPGYDFNDVNDIRRAAADPDHMWRRRYALQVLTYRVRGAAKEMLRSALADPYVSVRCDAARLLAVLGDPNGLESMRRDFAEVTKEPTETGTASAGWDRGDFVRKDPNTRIANALATATVLAEFGDTTGYQLARKTVLQSKAGFRRSEAAMILAELGKLPEATLKAKDCDPEAALLAMLEKEISPSVISLTRMHVPAKMKTKPASIQKIRWAAYEAERRLGQEAYRK